MMMMMIARSSPRNRINYLINIRSGFVYATESICIDSVMHLRLISEINLTDLNRIHRGEGGQERITDVGDNKKPESCATVCHEHCAYVSRHFLRYANNARYLNARFNSVVLRG